jgi:transposase-like protein
MNITADIKDFFCINRNCSDFGKRGQGNIIVYNRYGSNNRRLLKCKTCNIKFSERRNSFFFGLHTEETKVRDVISHLLKGKSVREAASITGIDKDTVMRIWKKFVAYCEESMEGLLGEFNLRLEDLIRLLYERGEVSKKARDKGRYELS